MKKPVSVSVLLTVRIHLPRTIDCLCFFLILYITECAESRTLSTVISKTCKNLKCSSTEENFACNGWFLVFYSSLRLRT